MRLLHTSDWHLGRSLHRADLGPAQAAFLDSLVETVRAERVDAVLVAGDVFDRAIPPVDAVGLFEDALERLRRAGARVVLTSGNHDSARRLGCNARLLDAAGVHVRTRVEALGEPVLLEDAYGPVAVYGIPFLEPDAVRLALTSPGEEPPRGHAGVLAQAIMSVRADLAARGMARSVVLAHAWVAGGAPSDSEREISVGGVAAVPARLFDGITYSALGHLHGRQTLGAALRYSGSPLPYSFSEAGHVKGSWLVELDARGLGSVQLVPAPVGRRLSTLHGTLDELLTSRAFDEHAQDFLSVTLTDRARPAEAMARLSTRYPHLLVLRHEPEGGAVDERGYAERVRGRTDLDVATGFVEHVRRSPASATERELLARAFEVHRGVLAEIDPTAPAAGCGFDDDAAEVA
jgi:exonuclease SbcD